MKTESITFYNEEGIALAGRIHRPIDDAPVAWALFAHCFTCSKDLRVTRLISESLAEQGIGTLRFDFTGLGESQGDFSDTGFASQVSDLVAAAQWMEDNLGAPALLVGHSLGGAAVLRAAGSLSSVTAVATIGAPSTPAHVKHLFGEHCHIIEQDGEADVPIGGRTFKIKRQFLEDIEAHPMEQVIGDLRRALLVFHAPLDQVVGLDNARGIFQAARHPKSFVSLDGADHLLTRPADARYVGAVLSAWAMRYIHTGEARLANLDARGHQVVVGIGHEHYRTEALAGGHPLVMDEPQSLGGTDLGASPYDLILAGLGGCTAITLRMYADRKEWPLEEVHVRLTHKKMHASDCAECETTEGRIDVIRREVQLMGPLDDKQRSRLLAIADRCPVHRTFHGEIEVLTSLV